MKTIMNKLRYTLLLGFIALAALGNSLDAATLTVCDQNTTTSNYVPFYGYYHDIAGTTVQMIYPSTMLNAMTGGTITSVKFYTDGGIKRFSGGLCTVTMGLTDATTLSSQATISGTTVSATFVPSQGMTEIELTFNPGLTLTSGKNLIIQTVVTTAGTAYDSSSNMTKFVGCSQNYNCAYVNKNSIGAQKFLPKATFGYTPSSTPAISASPTNLTFNTAPNNTQSQTVNVTGLNLTGNISATISGADASLFSVGPASLGTSGGTLTISYSPTAEGSHTATITLSSTGAQNVTINLSGTSENSIIVADGSDGSTVTTNAYLPIYAYYYDDCQKNQMIYPASMLTDLAGKTITSMTFYATNDFNFSGGQMTVRLGTTTNQDHYTSKTRLQPADMKIVKSGFDVPSGGNIWTIVFDSDKKFDYNGGNLVVDFEETSHGSGAGSYGANGFSFHGISHTGGGFYSNADTYDEVFSNVYSGGSVQNFLPKVKFLWEVSTPITNGTVSPNSVDFGTQAIGGTFTATVTVSNTGNQPFTPTIDITNLPQGITVSPTTIGQMNGGGTQNLTVTFTPTAEQSYSGSFTVTIPVPNDNDIVVTVTVTGSGFYANRLTSNTTAEIPVYKSEAKADGTYIFSKNDVDGDINRTLSYGNGNVNVEVLVKDEEPVTSYDLRHKVGSANWASVATATQDASNPKVYAYNNETFTIPNDATEMWIPMTDAGVDASSVIYYVPVTYANGIVTQGNTYGAPQVQATTDPVSFNVTVSGWKSAQGVGAHWTQTVGEQEIDYCIYMPLITVSEVSPAFTESRVPYKFRAWLTDCTDGVALYNYKRVENANDPAHSHIEGDTPLTLPKYLGELSSDFELTGSGPYIIGDDPYDENAPRPDGDVQPLNTFAAPSVLPDGAKFTIVVRAYYYQVPETRGAVMLRDGEGAPADGYGYGEGSGEGQGGSFMTAVNDVYTDRVVVDVKYVNLQGMQSDKPFDGINIVVTRYSDGSTSTTKVVR